MAGQAGLRVEVLAALVENGPGSGPMRQTAASFRQLAQTFETLASEVESLLAQLLSTTTGVMADAAADAFRQFVTGAREMATVANGVSEQADAQAVATDNVRSSMPSLAEVLRVLAAIAAALSSQNYGLAAALTALYNLLSARGSSAMSTFEAASLPNMEQTPPQPPPPITNPSANASDAFSQLLDKFTGQAGQAFTPEKTELPAALEALSGNGFGGGGPGFDGIAGNIGLIPGTVAALTTGFIGLAPTTGPMSQPGGVPATASSATPMGPGGVPVGARPVNGEKRERPVKKPDDLPGVVVDADGDVAPEVPGAALGVVADAGTDADAEAEQQA